MVFAIQRDGTTSPHTQQGAPEWESWRLLRPFGHVTSTRLVLWWSAKWWSANPSDEVWQGTQANTVASSSQFSNETHKLPVQTDS